LKKELIFTINCGEKTCASEPGAFFQFFKASLNGLNGKNYCYLFGSVFDDDGWIQRHDKCLKLTGDD